jgi:mRNA interferase RelE/StbE
MRFEILIEEAAEQDYRGLPPEVRERVKQRLFALGSDPLPPSASHLSGDLKGLCRLRVGDYRIVYHLDTAARTLAILAIADRRAIYDIVRRRRQ